MSKMMLPSPGLSPVNGKALSARFDGGALGDRRRERQGDRAERSRPA